VATNSSPLKIVHLDTGRQLRGGQSQLLLLARGLQRRGHAQIIVCEEESELERRARKEGFRIFSLPAHDPGHAYGTLQLRQFLRAERFEILHAHDGRGQTIAWLASAGFRVRRVASRRVTYLPADRWSHRLKYTLTCHAVVAISSFVRQLLLQAGLPEAMIEVIPDGVEIPSELPVPDARSAARARWGFGEREFVIGHLGAFTPEKGQDVALEAFLLLGERLPHARLLLAGDGPLRWSAKITANLRRAQGRAQLCGIIEDLGEFFSALDLFVMPSKCEGLGSSALLAMAFGLPVVASSVGGLPEIVEEGKTGWLVPPDSAPELAGAIILAVNDPARRREFGSNARERARQFAADIMGERTEALYRRLLAAAHEASS
jgi:glycosyltransferase involved in cell wall biosynthesis